MKNSTTVILLLLFILSLFTASSNIHASNMPRMTYQSAGPNLPLFLQRVSDPSFETGIGSWTQIFYNNYTGSNAKVVTTGYNDNSAAQLTINSGNLTIDSHLNLQQDFSKTPIPFGNGVRLRAAILLNSLQGNTPTDRFEISLSLTSSIGNQTRIHYVLASGSSLPANTTRDGYIKVPGFGSTGWILLDRNSATDALTLFPGLYSSLTTVRDVQLSVFSTSQGTPTHDPRILYEETGGDSYWNTTEAVIFDPDADGTYNAATDTILRPGSGPTSNGTILHDDPWIKYVDTNLNGQWDPTEPIVYDMFHEGVYDNAKDPVIKGNPIAGSILQDPVRKQTSATFDQVELYSAAGNYNGVLNGGFETGNLASWGNTAGFTTATSPMHSGLYSAAGVAVGTTIGLAQSNDARPVIGGSTRLQASAYVSGMSGGSAPDKVDIWLGLVDSSPNANPLSIYYYIKTGTDTIPANTTDTTNHRVTGFGSTGQWLSLNQTLLQDTMYFNLTGYTAPYRIETIVLEVSAQASATTSAYFDDVSIPTIYKPDSTISTYYAADGLNSTYAYSATKVPQGQFYLSVPIGQSVLNVTSPIGTVVQPSGYSTQTMGGALLITIANSTSYSYPALSNWHIYTTSKNALATLYTTPVGSNTASSSYDPGSTINMISQTKDPSGNAISFANITILFYSSNTQAFTGQTNSQGWYNRTIVLPQNSGTNNVEAITVSNGYIGLRTTQLTINQTTPWGLIIYASIAAAALAIFGLFLFQRRRKKQSPPSTITTPTSAPKNIPPKGKPAKPGNKI